MTYDEAYEYINRHGWSSNRNGFERSRRLLAALGNPQKKLKFVHVAGTNGKGSTCAMLGAVLQRAGYTVGLFPSPFIEDFTERIQVNGEHISRDDMARLAQTVADAADAMEDHPLHFELITAMGMLYFLEKGCDIVVLEVGMGGAHDATNVIDAPEVAVICNIGLDHTEYLGDTVEEIAAVKAGIIKTGSDVVVYDNIPSVIEVIAAKAREQGCPLHLAFDIEITPVSSDLHGQVFTAVKTGISVTDDPDAADASDVTGASDATDSPDAPDATAVPSAEHQYSLSLLGRHQLRNAQVALETIDVLRSRGWNISEEAVTWGLANVQWPVRFEVMGYDPVFIIDGGHNPQCAQAMAESIAEYLPNQKVTLVIGMLADKDYKTSIATILPYAAECITITPDNSRRALPARELAEIIREYGCPAQAVEADDPEEAAREAIRLAISMKRPVVTWGSLYSAGTIRHCYREMMGR